MNKHLLLFLVLTLSLNSYSQITFEQGYYINNSGQKTDCLIKNVDWRNNPSQFKYRLSNNSEIQLGTIKSVKEFGINNKTKYVRSFVKIDQSSENINILSYERAPSFTEETLFLKVLVEGKANLYQYEDGILIRYFFSKESSDIEQLVYKSYKTKNNKITENNSFKNQLWNDLKCPTFKIDMVENLKYKKSDLIDFFIKYNDCTKEGYINYEKKQKRDLFNLNFRPGFNTSSLSTRNSVSSRKNTDFDNELTFRFGLEAEFILPFNKNKWAIIFEPTYQYFKSETELYTNEGVEADYQSIELPIGIRHYFFLGENSKIFINGSLHIAELSMNSLIDYDYSSDLEIKSRNNLAFGLGFKYKDTYSLELRYLMAREILGDYVHWASEYQTFSVILGYSIF